MQPPNEIHANYIYHIFIYIQPFPYIIVKHIISSKKEKEEKRRI